MPSRLMEAFKADPVHHHHKDYVDFTSLREVPDTYKWSDQVDASKPDPVEPIPVIDLVEPNAMEKIGYACRTWGAFQVINHGVSMKHLDNIESVCNSLFGIATEQKLKAARAPEGITGYGIHRIAPFFDKLMWSEGFTVVGSPLEHFQQLWPQDYFKFCNMVETYQEEMQKLACRLMWLMLGSLGITMKDIKWAGPKGEFDGSSAALQLNHYPACPDPDRVMGLGAHTDSTLLTILYQNSTSGLQVQRDGYEWITVPPVSSALVVNVGDLLHILSNGSFASAVHRAMVNRSKDRISTAYLYGPPPSVRISPHKILTGPNRPPLYRSVTWNEYLSAKAKHFNNALSTVRVSANE